MPSVGSDSISACGDFLFDFAQLRVKRLAAPAAGQPRGHALDGFPRLENLEDLLKAEPAHDEPPIGLLFQEAVRRELPENLTDRGAAHAVGFAKLALDHPLPGRQFLLDDLPPDVFIDLGLVHSGQIVYKPNSFVK